MDIEADRVVGLAYSLTDAEGNQIESRTEDDPLYYLHGHEDILPGLEESLKGFSEGDEFNFTLPAGQAYGEYDEELVQRVARNQIPESIELDLGRHLQLMVENDQGEEVPVYFIVKNLTEDEVVLDANHPLAGRDLEFDGEIVEVREATEEELARGGIEEEV